MSILRKIFGKDKESFTDNEGEEEPGVPILEISESELGGERSGSIEPINMLREDLDDPEKVEEAVRIVQEGDIVVLDITSLMEEDPGVLKDSVDRLKEEVTEFDGNIARISDSLVLIVPKFVDFESRKKKQSGE